MIATLVPTGFFWGLVQIESMLKSCFIWPLLFTNPSLSQISAEWKGLLPPWGWCPVLHELNVCASGFPISLSWTPLLDFWLKFLLNFFPPFVFATQEKKSIAKRNTLKHPVITTRQFAAVLMEGSLSTLNPQASISSYCHFAFPFECVNFEPNSQVCRPIVEWVYWVRLVSMASSKGKMGFRKGLKSQWLLVSLARKESEACNCSRIIYPRYQVRERTWHF